ncbi:hypothetical protein ACOJUR_10420 [Alicyclobacillus tolerans]|uniref:hypothetical protein n=1 Tax=Alicyclobacillus tolerans TaxID=90970 RepID=UPI003B822A7C
MGFHVKLLISRLKQIQNLMQLESVGFVLWETMTSIFINTVLFISIVSVILALLPGWKNIQKIDTDTIDSLSIQRIFGLDMEEASQVILGQNELLLSLENGSVVRYRLNDKNELIRISNYGGVEVVALGLRSFTAEIEGNKIILGYSFDCQNHHLEFLDWNKIFNQE